MVDYESIKERLKHVYFVNGTAYAGKSTVCKILAKKHNMVHCEENYNFNEWLETTTPKTHPNMNYFKTMGSWEEFITRSKEDYDAWMIGVSLETTPFEIQTLLSLPNDRKIIVDTNIPTDILKKISDYNHVLYMLSTPEIAMEYFFNRNDKEKEFLLGIIKNTKNPDETYKQYKETIAYINRLDVIEQFKKSGFKYIQRVKIEESIEEKVKFAEEHFKLN